MQGNKKVIQCLNEVLTKELTAINQYFLHARMLENMGINALGGFEYKASIKEMKLADEVIKRILFLEGLPNLQKLDRLRIGQDVKEIVQSDLEVEKASVEKVKKHIQLCETEEDYISRELLQTILAAEEDRIDFYETQLDLIDKMGLKNYIQSQA